MRVKGCKIGVQCVQNIGKMKEVKKGRIKRTENNVEATGK